MLWFVSYAWGIGTRGSLDTEGEGRKNVLRPTSVFSKHTSNAVSAKLVNAIRFSPAMSLGRP